MIGYLKWRMGLAVGKALKGLGGRIMDAGWNIEDHSACHWYQAWFTEYDRRNH